MGKPSKRKKKRFPSATPWARGVWRRAFGDQFPSGWRVEWAGFMRGAVGLCLYREQRILLSYGDRRRYNPVATLIHEFLHVRGFKRHNQEFKDEYTRTLLKFWAKDPAQNSSILTNAMGLD